MTALPGYRTILCVAACLGFATVALANPPFAGRHVPARVGLPGPVIPPPVPYPNSPAMAPTFFIWMPDPTPRVRRVDVSWIPAELSGPAPDRQVLRGHEGPITCVAFSPDGSTLASGSKDRTVIVWDLVARGQKVRLRGHTAAVTALSFSSDGITLATGGQDRSVILWDLPSGQKRASLGNRPNGVSALAFAPDGSTLAAGGQDGKIELWDVASRHVRRTLDGRRGPVWDLTFAPDGRLAAGHFQTDVVLWDSSSGQILRTTRAWHNGSTTVAASLFGQSTLALARKGDAGISLLDAPQGQLLGFLPGHAGAVRCLAFAPGGKALASGGMDRIVRLWDLPAEYERYRAYLVRLEEQRRRVEEEARRAKDRDRDRRSDKDEDK